jgi:hypothetical protein
VLPEPSYDTAFVIEKCDLGHDRFLPSLFGLSVSRARNKKLFAWLAVKRGTDEGISELRGALRQIRRWLPTALGVLLRLERVG